MINVQHEQVPFVNAFGRLVEVDKGLVDILEKMKRLGVITNYSCEGNLKHAYILADGPTAKELEKRIVRLYKAGALSPASEYTVQKFLLGARLFNFSWFKGPTYLVACLRFRRRRTAEYRIERSYENHYGFRITYRWPPKDTFRIEELLDEVSRKIHAS